MTHDFLTATLDALSFDMNDSTWYLTIKMNSSFSSYLDIFQCFPQRSILEPLWFYLFFCDCFLFVKEDDIISYEYDKSGYVYSENVDVILQKLEEVGKVLFELVHELEP